jgi:hypothetical protein
VIEIELCHREAKISMLGELAGLPSRLALTAQNENAEFCSCEELGAAAKIIDPVLKDHRPLD